MAPKTLGLSGTPFHESFHGRRAAAASPSSAQKGPGPCRAASRFPGNTPGSALSEGARCERLAAVVVGRA
jgi:hypothetical protein